MDPISVGGLTLSVSSLAFDVFDHSVKLFRFFCSVLDMPKEFERYRLQLTIEYHRLLAWGVAVGLVDVPSGSDLASSLGTNAMELCIVVARIGGLLEELKELDDRWKDETQTCQPSGQPVIEKEVDVRVQVSSLVLMYEKGREKRKQCKGLKRIATKMSKGAESAKEILSNPRRARWVATDKTAFENSLSELHGLIERIHGLMNDYHGKQILETTAKTYREMVIFRNDLSELKDMFYAVASIMESSKTDSQQARNNETLWDLLLLKKIKYTSEEILSRAKKNGGADIMGDLEDMVDVSQYDGTTFTDCFKRARDGGDDAPSPHRSRGTLDKQGKHHEVWIEWRSVENVIDGSMECKESMLRTATLAQMLSVKKPGQLLSPTCIGYVDDREQQYRVGWIFEMPHGSDGGTMLKALHGMLGSKLHKPSLTYRISLAWKLASSLLHLHAADWLHKGVHSGNIVFAVDQEAPDWDRPILSGFEYSRPQNNRTTSRSLDPRWDIYRWPGIQNEVPRIGNSRKTYDIYSLGLLLLEIAHWQPLHELMSLKRWPSPSTQDCRIRAWLLDEEPLPPFKQDNPLLALRSIAGDKYFEAARQCIVAHGKQGMRIEEDADQSRPEVAIELQAAFTELVVEKVKNVSV